MGQSPFHLSSLLALKEAFLLGGTQRAGPDRSGLVQQLYSILNVLGFCHISFSAISVW